MSLREFVSMEGIIDGQRHREIEYTFYGKVSDMTQLSRAIKREEHEQWLLPVETEVGKVRIRALDGMRWILTTKVKREGVVGWEEVECDISKDMFEHLREMSTGGMKKTRYIFKIDGTDKVWEMDVFKDAMGQDHLWVKLDLEVANEDDNVPPLPVDMAEMIWSQSSQQTDQEKSFIAKLWGSEWVSLDPNQRTE